MTQARALGAEEVTLVYRRSADEMPAYAHEVQLAREYGCRFVYQAAPLKIVGKKAVEGIELQKMRLGAPDASGRRKPEAIAGEVLTLECDMVIAATGQEKHLELLERLPNVRLDRGRVVVDERTMQTSNPRYFAGGDFAGIQSPNPFWLASAPPTNTGEQIMRAFDAGWGGAVWKTLGDPIVNVSSRYSSVDWNGQRMMGLNNIELITDRPLEVNLREIAEVKKRYPKNAVIVSLMVESKREAWHEIVKAAEDAGADGLELNFGCPHGMCERGMGSAVGQVPEYACMITEWVKEAARTPVIVKLTPNITDIRHPARAAKKGGADAVSLINTINSIIGVDLDTFAPRPDVGGRSAHGGYCGPAVKPIALNMVSSVAKDPEVGCRSPASAASPPGATRPSSSRSAPPPSRCARRSCTTASASSRT